MRKKYALIISLQLAILVAVLLDFLGASSLFQSPSDLSCQHHVPRDILQIPEMMSVSISESLGGGFIVRSIGSHGCNAIQVWACEGSGMVYETGSSSCGMGNNLGQYPIMWTQNEELILEERIKFNTRPNGIYLFDPDKAKWTLLFANLNRDITYWETPMPNRDEIHVLLTNISNGS